MTRREKIVFLTLSLVLGFFLALQLKALNARPQTVGETTELQANLLSYIKKNEALAQRNLELNHYIEQLEQDLKTGDFNRETVLKEKERAAIFAGLRPVQNSGLTVQFSPSANMPMRDAVLWQFCNELAALGAQAISINDQRKVAMTEIRETNENIVINGKAFKKDQAFTFKAILDPDNLDYAVQVLDSLKKQINSELSLNYDIQIHKEKLVKIPALEENSHAYKTDLLTVVTK